MVFSPTEYLQKIERTDAFVFGAIVILSVYFTTTLVPTTLAQIAGVVLGFAIIGLLEDRNRSNIRNFNREFEVKLSQIIPRPEYFHIDVNVIDLFDNVRDFKAYNGEAWTQMIKATDNVLRLHSDMRKGLANCVDHIETARMFKDNAVNHFHSFIMSIPSNPVLDEKFKKNIARFELLLRRHIDDMYRICKKQSEKQGWSIHRRPLIDFGPRPDDTGAIGHSRFDYYY